LEENKKIKLTVNELFSGIGCQTRGFRDSGVFDIEVVNTSEISKESVLSYAAIHCGLTDGMVISYKGYPSKEEMAQHLMDINLGYDPEKGKKSDWLKLVKRKKKDLEKYWLACKLTHNLGDISKIEELPYADLWTCSFPCTDISVCGKMKGLNPDSGTRSSLLWENIRLLKKAKDSNSLPKYIMFENVKNLVSKKFINNFNDLLGILDGLGFNSYYSIINGKNCGVPQSRERVFVISIRKDIDKGKYVFPKPFDTGIRLKDILEKEVDEKYYLPDEKVKKFLKTIDLEKIFRIDNELHQVGYINNYNGDANRVYSDNISRTLKSEAGGGGAKTGWYLTENNILKVGEINSSQDGIVVSPEGISPTHTAGHGNNAKIICGIDKTTNNPKIIENANCITASENRGSSNRKKEGTAVLEIPDITVLVSNQGTKSEKEIDFACTLLARDHKGFGNQPTNAVINGLYKTIRIRKLTPKECYKLMGLTFEDCDKAAEIGIANTHLYKQAGNGIITNCCALLAEHLYKAQYDDTYICTDEKLQESFIQQHVDESICCEHKSAILDGVGAAMRGRYNSNEEIKQKIEIRNDGLSNAITTAPKDSLVVENFQKLPMN